METPLIFLSSQSQCYPGPELLKYIQLKLIHNGSAHYLFMTHSNEIGIPTALRSTRLVVWSVVAMAIEFPYQIALLSFFSFFFRILYSTDSATEWSHV